MSQDAQKNISSTGSILSRPGAKEKAYAKNAPPPDEKAEER
jgi:hypothetical protein